MSESAFSHYKILIKNAGTQQVLRTISPVYEERFIYELEWNSEDHGGTPARSFIVELYRVDEHGNESLPETITVNNPAPAAPSNLNLAEGFNAVLVKPDLPTDRDLSGMQVWVGTSPGFALNASTLKYDGPNTEVSIPVATSGTYYVKAAFFDTFGRYHLNVSAEASIAITVGTTNPVDTTPPGDPYNFTVDAAFSTLIAEWTNPGDNDLEYTEVWVSADNQINNATLRATPFAPTASAAISGLANATTFYVWVRAVDRAGNGSNFVGPVSASTRRLITDEISDSIINANKLAAEAVTAGKIAAAAVGNSHLADLAVNAQKLADNAVTLQKLADGSVGLTKFASGLTPVEVVATLPITGNFTGRTVVLTTDGKLYRYASGEWTSSVTATDITGQVQAAQIAALEASKITGQLTNAQIADLAATKVTGQLTDAQIADLAATKVTGQITGTQISDSAISTPKLAAGAITTAKIAAGAITAGEIAANAVTSEKIIAGAITTAKIAAGAITAGEIAANAVTSEKIIAGAITTAKIAAGAITAGEIAANAVIAGKIATNAVTAGTIAANAVTAASIAANAVTAGKIAAGAVSATEIAAGAVLTDKLAANAVTAAKIAAGTITANEIASATITGDRLVANTITATQIAANTITAAQIAASTITASQLAANSVTAAQIAANAVTAAKILAGSIATDKLAAGAVVADKIGAGAITTDKLAASAVTAAKIAAGTITADKISAGTFTGDEFNAAANITVGSGSSLVRITGDPTASHSLWLGAAIPAEAKFSVSKLGDIVAKSLTLQSAQGYTLLDPVNYASDLLRTQMFLGSGYRVRTLQVAVPDDTTVYEVEFVGESQDMVFQGSFASNNSVKTGGALHPATVTMKLWYRKDGGAWTQAGPTKTWTKTQSQATYDSDPSNYYYAEFQSGEQGWLGSSDVEIVRSPVTFAYNSTLIGLTAGVYEFKVELTGEESFPSQTRTVSLTDLSGSGFLVENDGSTVGSSGAPGGFLSLVDTPGTYGAQSRRVPQVRSDELGIQFSELSKITDILNVRDFGIHPSNLATTNDAAWNSLKTRIETGEFGSTFRALIYFPPGTFKFHQLLSVPYGCIIQGAGSDTTQFKFTEDGAGALTTAGLYWNLKTAFGNLGYAMNGGILNASIVTDAVVPGAKAVFVEASDAQTGTAVSNEARFFTNNVEVYSVSLGQGQYWDVGFHYKNIAYNYIRDVRYIGSNNDANYGPVGQKYFAGTAVWIETQEIDESPITHGVALENVVDHLTASDCDTGIKITGFVEGQYVSHSNVVRARYGIYAKAKSGTTQPSLVIHHNHFNTVYRSVWADNYSQSYLIGNSFSYVHHNNFDTVDWVGVDLANADTNKNLTEEWLVSANIFVGETIPVSKTGATTLLRVNAKDSIVTANHFIGAASGSWASVTKAVEFGADSSNTSFDKTNRFHNGITTQINDLGTNNLIDLWHKNFVYAQDDVRGGSTHWQVATDQAAGFWKGGVIERDYALQDPEENIRIAVYDNGSMVLLDKSAGRVWINHAGHLDLSGPNGAGRLRVDADNLNVRLINGANFGVNGGTIFGVGGFTLAGGGSLATPVIRFDNDANTGFVNPSTGLIQVATAGSLAAQFGTTQFLAPTGTGNATPGVSFIGDTNTGLYRAAADQINVVTGGSARMQVTTGNVGVVNATMSIGRLGGEGGQLTMQGHQVGAVDWILDIPTIEQFRLWNTAGSGQFFLTATKDSSINLFYAGTDVAGTHSGGLDAVTAFVIRGTSTQLYADNVQLGADIWLSRQGVNSAALIAGGVHQLAFSNTNVSLRYSGSEKLHTTSAGVTVTGTLSATTFSGSGASLTALNASNISTGTLADARLSTNVALQPWVTAQLANYLPLTGGTLSGTLTLGNGYLNGGPGTDLFIQRDGSNRLRFTATTINFLNAAPFIASNAGSQIQFQPPDNVSTVYIGAPVSGLASIQGYDSVALINKTMATFDIDGGVFLNYNNAQRLETTSAGGTLTGTWNATTNLQIGGANVATQSYVTTTINKAYVDALNVDADTLDGQYAREMSWGHHFAHSVFSDFNTFLNTDYFGAHYVLGTTNGPGHPGAAQYYHQRMSLGSDYNQYSLQFAIPRGVSDAYLYYRFEEAGVAGSWNKMRAGYADTAGDATTLGGAAPSSSAGVGTIVQRSPSGYIFNNYFNMTANTTVVAATKIAVETNGDKYLRWQTPAQFITNHGIATTAALGSYLPLTGGTLSGTLTLGNGYLNGGPGTDLFIQRDGSNRLRFTATTINFLNAAPFIASNAGSQIQFQPPDNVSTVYMGAPVSGLASIQGYDSVALINKTMATFDIDGGVFLNYNNAQRLETTSAGGTLTGTWNATTNLQIGGASVATQSWVNSQGFTTGGPFLPLAGGTLTGGVISTNGISRYYTNSGQTIEAATGQITTHLQVYQDTVGADALMVFHVSGDYAAYFGLDGSRNDFVVGGWSMGANSYKIFHEGNFTPGNYLPLAGGTMTGNLTFSSGGEIIKQPTGILLFSNAGGLSSSYGFWDGIQIAPASIPTSGGANSYPRLSMYWGWSQNADPTDMAFNIATSNTPLKADINLIPANGGVIKANGNAVWHAGNFTPGNYLPLTGGTITGNLVVQDGTNGQTFATDADRAYLKYRGTSIAQTIADALQLRPTGTLGGKLSFKGSTSGGTWNDWVFYAQSGASQFVFVNGTTGQVHQVLDGSGVTYLYGGGVSPSITTVSTGGQLNDGAGNVSAYWGPATGTIGGVTWDNGWLKIGTNSLGWAFDNNEIYNSGEGIIGTLSGNLLLRPAGNLSITSDVVLNGNVLQGVATAGFGTGTSTTHSDVVVYVREDRDRSHNGNFHGVYSYVRRLDSANSYTGDRQTSGVLALAYLEAERDGDGFDDFLYGLNAEARNTASTDAYQMIGAYGKVRTNSGMTTLYDYGVYGYTDEYGTVTQSIGAYGYAGARSGSDVENLFGVWGRTLVEADVAAVYGSRSYLDFNSGTVPNAYLFHGAVDIEAANTTTNIYGMVLNLGSNMGGTFSNVRPIWAQAALADNPRSSINGWVHIGGDNGFVTPSAALHVIGGVIVGTKTPNTSDVAATFTPITSYAAGVQVRNYDAAGWARLDLVHDSASAGAELYQDSSGQLTLRNDSNSGTSFAFNYGGTTLASINNTATLTVGGHFVMDGSDPYLRTNADNKHVVVSGGSGWTPTGATTVWRGVASGYNPGGIEFLPGDNGGGAFRVEDGFTSIRLGADVDIAGNSITNIGAGSGEGLFFNTGASIRSLETDTIVMGVSQLRFGEAANWDWNSWAGLKFDHINEIMYIGGPAGSQFTAGTSPPTISVELNGVSTLNLGGATISDASLVQLVAGGNANLEVNSAQLIGKNGGVEIFRTLADTLQLTATGSFGGKIRFRQHGGGFGYDIYGQNGANDLVFQNVTGGITNMLFTSGGETWLYGNNAVRLQTTAAGGTLTGNWNVSNLLSFGDSRASIQSEKTHTATTEVVWIRLGRIRPGVHTLRIANYGNSGFNGEEVTFAMDWAAAAGGSGEHPYVRITHRQGSAFMTEIKGYQAVFVSTTEADIYVHYDNTFLAPATTQTIRWHWHSQNSDPHIDVSVIEQGTAPAADIPVTIAVFGEDTAISRAYIGNNTNAGPDSGYTLHVENTASTDVMMLQGSASGAYINHYRGDSYYWRHGIRGDSDYEWVPGAAPTGTNWKMKLDYDAATVHFGSTGATFGSSVYLGGPLYMSSDTLNYFTTGTLRVNHASSRARMWARGDGTGYTTADVLLENADTDGRGIGTYMYNRASGKEWFVGQPYSGSGTTFVIAHSYQANGSEGAATADISNRMFSVTSTGVMGVKDNVWHTSLEGVNRLLFSPSSSTYIAAAASSPVHITDNGGEYISFYPHLNRIIPKNSDSDTYFHHAADNTLGVVTGGITSAFFSASGIVAKALATTGGSIILEGEGTDADWLWTQNAAQCTIGTGTYVVSLMREANGDILLYYAGAKKFQTTSTGVTVTGTLAETSDRSVKDGIREISGSVVEMLKRLRPREYHNRLTGKYEQGFVAQEVNDVAPWLVTPPSNDNNLWTMNYRGLIAPLVQATVEIDERVTALENERQELLEENAALTERVSDLEARLARIEELLAA